MVLSKKIRMRDYLNIKKNNGAIVKGQGGDKRGE
jgi:hypothetical protein